MAKFSTSTYARREIGVPFAGQRFPLVVTSCRQKSLEIRTTRNKRRRRQKVPFHGCRTARVGSRIVPSKCPHDFPRGEKMKKRVLISICGALFVFCALSVVTAPRAFAQKG